MDAALVGGIVGASIFIGGYALFRLYEVWKKKRNLQNHPVKKNNPEPKKIHPLTVSHWKVNRLFTPKKIVLLKNLKSNHMGSKQLATHTAN